MASRDKHRGQSDAWNAYFVAPLVTGVGTGVVFGSLFSMGKPAYAVLLVAGAGFAVIILGLLILRSLGKGDNDSDRA